MKNWLTILMTMLLITSCDKNNPCPQLNLADGNISNAEAYTIIETIISDQYENFSLVPINQESFPASTAEIIRGYRDEHEVQVEDVDIENYISLNEVSAIWGENLFVQSQTLINKEEINCHFETQPNGWDSFYASYQESTIGYLEFSQPLIYNNEMAFIEYGQFCGWECGFGFMVILSKENGNWKISQYINTWIS